MPDPSVQTRLPALQWRLVQVWAVLALGFVAMSLAGLTLDRTPLEAAGRANLDSLRPFWMASACSWAALTAIWWMLAKKRITIRPADFSRHAVMIFMVAAAARVAVLLTHNPSLSDDVYRYVFDGRNLAHSVNPYLDTPASRAGFATDEIIERPLGVLDDSTASGVVERWPGEADLLPRINNPELHTIYLPASQYAFAAAGLVMGDRPLTAATGALVIRAEIVLFELIAIALVMVLLRRAGRSAWWAALYAWHPLPLAEFAGSGHQDSIGIALMMLGLLLFTIMPRRVWMWIATLALGALVKPVVIPVAAYMLKDLSLRRANHGDTRRGGWFILVSCLRQWKMWVLSAVVGATVCSALSAPLWLTHDRAPLENLRETSSRFSLKWAHFGSAYEASIWTIRRFDPIEDLEIEWQKKERHEVLGRIICLSLVAIVCLVALFSRVDAITASRAMLFAMVLFSTTAHPWYLAWALILTPLAAGPAIWIASLTLLAGYAQLGDVVDWETPNWVMWAAYVPIYAALVFDLVRKILTTPR